MNRKLWSAFVCLVIGLATLAAFPIAVRGDYIPHIIYGFVGGVDPADPGNFANATIYNVDNSSLPLLYQADINDTDGTDPAYWFYDVGGEWNWFPGNDTVVVLETRPGVNGYVGTENLTSSSDGILDLSNVQEFPSTVMEPIPTITPDIGSDAGMGYVNLSWTGLLDTNANVVNYTIYEQFDINPEVVIGYSAAQVSVGPMYFNRTGLTVAGQYCYNLAVNYRRGAMFYTTIGRSNTVCLSGTNITGTYPYDGQIGVPVDQFIWINFSSAMDTTPGRLVWTIFPDEGLGWTETWQLLDTQVELTHAGLFTECTWYTVNVTEAYDALGNPIWGVPYSFTFQTVCLNPMIVYTDPGHLDFGVSLWKDVHVNFSEPMDNTTVTRIITPGDGQWTDEWQNFNATLILRHSGDLAENTTYEVNITGGTDLDGLPLIDNPLVPNPWTFRTVAIPPTVVDTYPPNGATGIPLASNIWINFSEPMDTLSLVWSINPPILLATWTPFWSNGNQTLNLVHDLPYEENIFYVVTITAITDANDVALTPLPYIFSFTAEFINPTIISHYPDVDDTNISLTAPIIINFSEPMDTLAAFTWGINPAVPGLTPAWSNGNQTVTFTHAIDFLECTQYTFTVTEAYDLAGNNIDPSPYSWSFWTVCIEPMIIDRSPLPDAVGVPLYDPIVITFDKAMNTGTVVVTVGPIDPCPPGGWVPVWNTPTDTILTLDHPTCPFVEVTLYSVDVDGMGANDQPLNRTASAPLPWSFETVGIPPTVVSTDPFDTEPNVPLNRPITIQFSETMDTTAGQFTYNLNPVLGGLSHSWSQTVDLDDTVTIAHDDFTECVTYTVTITAARDNSTVNLDPLPYSFTFTAFCNEPMVISTDPVNGTDTVPVYQDVIVRFSEPMDTPTVTVTFDPDPGNVQYSWDAAEMNVTVTHDDFDPNTLYQATVVGQDLDGLGLIPGPVPNPFSFTTASLPPDVSITIPTGSEVWSGNTSHDITWTMSDDSSDDDALVVWLNYTSAVESGTIAGPETGFTAPFSYTWTQVACIDADDVIVVIEVYDEEGQVGTNTSQPFTIDCTAPEVSSTTPAPTATDVALDADIVITFSEGMDNTSLDWSISPNPGGWATPVWSADDTIVTLSHSNPFAAETRYEVTITTATKDDSDPGIGLEADYAFNFTTIVLIPNPPTNLGDRDVTSDELTLTWEAPTTYTNGDPIPAGTTITYTVYRAETATGPETQVETDLTTLYYTDTDVEAGETYYYTVTATVAGHESAHSEQHSVKVSEVAPAIDMLLLALILLIIIIIIIVIIAIALKRRKPEEIPEVEEVPLPPEEVVEEEVVEEAPPEEEVPEEVVEEAPPEEEVPEEVVEEVPPEEEVVEEAPPAEEVVEEEVPPPAEEAPEVPPAPPVAEEAVPPAVAAVEAEEAPPAEEPEEEPPAEGKVCPNCGTIVGEDDTTCFICGTEL